MPDSIQMRKTCLVSQCKIVDVKHSAVASGLSHIYILKKLKTSPTIAILSLKLQSATRNPIPIEMCNVKVTHYSCGHQTNDLMIIPCSSAHRTDPSSNVDPTSLGQYCHNMVVVQRVRSFGNCHRTSFIHAMSTLCVIQAPETYVFTG